MSPNEGNPYAKATSTYDNHAQAHTTNQRELEGRVLLKSNRNIQTLIDNWDERPKHLLEDVLTYNRQIWMLFYDTALENKGEGHTSSLRSNIVNLANFIFKRELEIISNPQKEKLEILMSINREIAAGLMVNNENIKSADLHTTKAAPEHNHSSGTRTDISG